VAPSDGEIQHAKKAEIEQLISVAKDAFAIMGTSQRLKVRIAVAEKELKEAGKRENEANQRLHLAKEEFESAKKAHHLAVVARHAACVDLRDAKALALSLAEKKRRTIPAISSSASASEERVTMAAQAALGQLVEDYNWPH